MLHWRHINLPQTSVHINEVFSITFHAKLDQCAIKRRNLEKSRLLLFSNIRHWYQPLRRSLMMIGSSNGKCTAPPTLILVMAGWNFLLCKKRMRKKYQLRPLHRDSQVFGWVIQIMLPCSIAAVRQHKRQGTPNFTHFDLRSTKGISQPQFIPWQRCHLSTFLLRVPLILAFYTLILLSFVEHLHGHIQPRTTCPFNFWSLTKWVPLSFEGFDHFINILKFWKMENRDG